MAILNGILALGIGYIVLFGLKDREPPTIEIIFPADNYEFRTNKLIKVSANDNKGIKSITYFIDNKLYHEENNTNPFYEVWNPCELRPGSHTLRVEAHDFSKHTTSTKTINFRIAPGLKFDCHGTCDGNARIDDCGVCSDGETDHQYNVDIDCTDTCFGSAKIDECGICSGGDTGLTPNIDKDCEGICFGNAYFDSCNVCTGGTTNHVADSDIDCNGDCFGKAKIDKCEVCSGGKTGIKKNANMDCAGVCFGDAYVNECMYCIEGTTGFKNTNNLEGDFAGAYGQDCNQSCDGKAIIDECAICTEGDTGYRYNEAMDCNGDCGQTSPLWDGNLGGTASLDECGVCSQGNSNHLPNIDKDCNGDCFGTATIDPCGGCTGGKTGIEVNQSLVKNKKKKYACGDLLFVMDIFSIKNPMHKCSSREVINNEEELSECISEYLELGEPRWNAEHRLISYTLPEQKIEGLFPETANYTTKLTYLDITKNLFWGSMPSTFCNIHQQGTLRIADNKFCPPYPDCLKDDTILIMDMEDMQQIARCNK